MAKLMDCRAIGSLSDDKAGELSQLLTGLAMSPPRPVNLHELVLSCTIPERDDLYLYQDHSTSTSTYPNTWTAVHYSMPLKGKSYKDLPATIRMMTPTECSGRDVVSFWQGVGGFQYGHQSRRKGWAYEIAYGGYNILLHATRLYRVDTKKLTTHPPTIGVDVDMSTDPTEQQQKQQQQPKEEELTDISPGYLLIEAIAVVEESKSSSNNDYIGAARAIGGIANLVSKYVVLSPFSRDSFRKKF